MRRLWTAVALAGLLASGCSSSADSEPASGADPAGGAAAVEIPLEIKSWDEVQQWVAGQQGKVVVLDVWSTYCQPCMKEFPHFVELHQQQGENVACASLSIDFYGGEGSRPEDVRPKVLEFLTSQNATMQNFISSDPDQTVTNQIDIVAIPATLVYDRQGELHKVFSNDEGEYGAEGYNYEQHVAPLVEQLLQ